MPEKDYKNMTALNPTTSLTETAAQTGFVPEIRKDATIGELDEWIMRASAAVSLLCIWPLGRKNKKPAAVNTWRVWEYGA